MIYMLYLVLQKLKLAFYELLWIEISVPVVSLQVTLICD
jgi:hypothetical protein